MRFRGDFVQANGDLMVAMARCLVCNLPRAAARGNAFAVEVECRNCEVEAHTQELRCPACNHHLMNCRPIVGLEVEARCDKCYLLVSVRRPSSRITFVSVTRPMTGAIALRFGIRPTPSHPVTRASGAPLRSCAT